MIKLLFVLTIFYVLLAMNFYLGLAVFSASALVWGLNTEHWRPQHEKHTF